jgi:hypothetical protein
VVELPKPPWYRRFGVVFVAANLVVAVVLVAAVVALWPRAAGQRPVAPATTAGVGRQAGRLLPEGPEPAAILPTSTRAVCSAASVAQWGGCAVERPGRYTVSAVSGVLFVVVLLVGLYVAPDLVYPEEQVGGVSGSFYVNYESRLLAQAVLFGVASVLFLFFLGGLRAFLARAEGQEPRLAPVVLAAGAVFTGLGLLQAATLTALVALRGNELGVRAQGSGWAARALFYLEGAIGDLALFPFAAFLAAAAMVLVRTRVLPGWLGWIGAALGLVVGLLAAGSIVGLDIEPADQAILVLALVWVAALAICLDWLPSASRRAGEALD